jgi:hypothetical protein
VVLSPLRTTAENIALVVLKHVLRSFSAHYPDTSRPDMRWTDDLAWYVKVQETETTEVQVNAEDLEMSDV